MKIDKVYLDIAPTPTYNITGIAVREVGTGNFVVEPIYDITFNFDDNGYAWVVLNSKYGLIDKSGKVVIEPHFENYKDAAFFVIK